MTSPAAELRDAAAKIRALAQAVEAPNSPTQTWHTEECADEERGDCPCIVAQGRYAWHDEPLKPLFYVADAETPECAAYIAAMHPGVGTALAAWLDDTADQLDAMPFPVTHATALAVARALNGGQQ